MARLRQYKNGTAIGLLDSLFQFGICADNDDVFFAPCDGRVDVLPRLVGTPGQHVHNAVRLTA